MLFRRGRGVLTQCVVGGLGVRECVVLLVFCLIFRRKPCRPETRLLLLVWQNKQILLSRVLFSPPSHGLSRPTLPTPTLPSQSPESQFPEGYGFSNHEETNSATPSVVLPPLSPETGLLLIVWWNVAQTNRAQGSSMNNGIMNRRCHHHHNKTCNSRNLVHIQQ